MKALTNVRGSTASDAIMVSEPLPKPGTVELCVSEKWWMGMSGWVGASGWVQNCRYSAHKEQDERNPMQTQMRSGNGANKIYATWLGCKRTRIAMESAWDNYYGPSVQGPAEGIREWCRLELWLELQKNEDCGNKEEVAWGRGTQELWWWLWYWPIYTVSQ